MRDLLYSLLLHTARLLVAALWWWRGRQLPEFRRRWNERRARIAYPLHAKNGIVVHAVSMGEVIAALPLVKQLQKSLPQLPITFTCTTPTASALIKQRLADAVTHVYMPFDTPGSVRRFLQGLQPRLLILMETELWPNLITQAHRAGARIVIANARLSERSAKRYRFARTFIAPTLSCIDLWLAQDPDTRSRLLSIGVAPALVKITGNLKMSMAAPVDTLQRSSELQQLVHGRTIWLAASTHAGEEVQILKAHQQILEQRSDVLLILVPRHPQRFEEVARLVQQQGFVCQQQSKSETCMAQTQVWLADSMGELMAWFSAAPIVFMGGSLVNIGGHNPLEPALMCAAVLTGPHVFNFQNVFDELQSESAVQFVEDSSGLADAVCAWLTQPEEAKSVGLRGQAWLQRQQGAAARCEQTISSLLGQHAPIALSKNRRLLSSSQIIWNQQFLGHASEPERWFDIGYWQQKKAVISQASGRGTTWFLRHTEGMEAETVLVWRHYFRGGLVGRILRDRFISGSADKSRSMQEFNLLERMRAWHLPVPRALAAKVKTQIAVQRCDLIMERVPDANDWVALLRQAPFPSAVWQAAGLTIANLHAHGVNHTDLNAHNLLLDGEQQIWIIDFDKCAAQLISLSDDGWEQRNLQRLKRSLDKEQRIAKQQGIAWHAQESDWQILLVAYRERFSELLVTAL